MQELSVYILANGRDWFHSFLLSRQMESGLSLSMTVRRGS